MFQGKGETPTGENEGQLGNFIEFLETESIHRSQVMSKAATPFQVCLLYCSLLRPHHLVFLLTIPGSSFQPCILTVSLPMVIYLVTVVIQP